MSDETAELPPQQDLSERADRMAREERIRQDKTLAKANRSLTRPDAQDANEFWPAAGAPTLPQPTGSMLIVPRAEMAPGFCLASMRHQDDHGFFDTGLTPPVVDPRVYISIAWVLEAARHLALVPAQTGLEQDAKIETLEARVGELEAELAAVRTLRNAGWKPSNAGRPPS